MERSSTPQVDASVFQSIFEHAVVGMACYSPQGRWQRVNRRLCEITGYSADELIGLSYQGVTHPDDLGRELPQLRRLLAGEISSFEIEKRYVKKCGSLVWVLVAVTSLPQPGVAYPLLVSVVRDIDPHHETRPSARVAQRRYQALFEQLPDGIVLLDASLQVLAFNAEAQRLLGYASEVLSSLHIWDIEAIDDLDQVERRRQRIEEAGRDDFESRYRCADGRLIDVDVSVKHVHFGDGERLFQVLFRDISQRKAASQLIERMAYSDQLTGLANRSLLADRLKHAMAQARRRGETLAVVFLDLDGFKTVNDHHGHQTGDRLLVALSRRMSEVLRAGDTLARLGGDEFVAVLADMPGAQACEALLQRLLDVACRPVRIDELELNVTASLGVTFFPQAEDVDADQLLRQADQAMYQAKLAGKNRFHLFDAASDRHLRGYIARVASLREALTMQQFVLHYQPKVNLKTRQLVGVEALLRWEHPQDGMLLPGRFLPQIEGHQLSLDIGSWVIRQALTQVATWRTLGHAIAVSVNVSPHQIRQADFVPWLEAELQARQLPPYCLELEILESSALHDLDQVAEFIRRCAAIQVGVALDDFGTGYSSLSHLKRFPTSTIKIDQTFVRDILHNADNKSILDGVLWIMRQLRRTVIAEGVETPAHGRALVDLGCELGQGYAIAWPMPAAELLDWLQVWSAVTPGPD